MTKALANIAAYRLNGHTIDDEDVDQLANIEISKLGTRTLFKTIPANAFVLDGAGVVSTLLGVFGGVTLPDANDGKMFASFALPDEWDSGNITVRVLWSTAAVAGDIRLVARVKSTVAGGSTTLEESVANTKTAGGTTNRLNDITMALAAADFTAGDVVGLQIDREPASGGDTLSADAKIFAICLEFTGRA